MMATVFISSKHVAARIEMEERKVGRNRVSPHFLHFLANSFGVAQLKLARCPHSLTASLAATPVRLGPFYACRAGAFAKAGRSSHSLRSSKSLPICNEPQVRLR